MLAKKERIAKPRPFACNHEDKGVIKMGSLTTEFEIGLSCIWMYKMEG